MLYLLVLLRGVWLGEKIPYLLRQTSTVFCEIMVANGNITQAAISGDVNNQRARILQTKDAQNISD